MKDEHGNGIAYAGDEGTVSVYHVWLDDRVVLHMLVDREDPKLRIGFTDPSHGEVRYRNGRAVRRYLDADENGSGTWRVSADSVKSYVAARLPWLLADAYAPKIEITT